ncbi:tRNA (uridine(34)/cytosine(34)/5-carboxymethylaminomethyluridine(34)-2'-O)-methyltransferase TrmL [Virgibacillus sp. NKC19-3]|uniref:tRNA (uridine(34)/cytosine(34)/5- carboxymethylaminomethyluridine(34)-2'-O)- methyltransferase TrmL n=1 Tax=Virgibacillus saliphilus TaxID=2831674 RepID=UPI001C9A41C0|nr:tRNA (uridine(34)/cytosine(34)/5-carboxymethylaminomethyluridine(34)-2'-O)-methyltransferase TrmL [Virgibacillus sp. NKC19-3]MBY7142990.1 tRNA (uridine(34)/cytosine(34)/5-carboxymethylaminomethyluridine(34)-2'-O)-methyltransferase TrmL [Virgibacillus sp. NKC19-3]
MSLHVVLFQPEIPANTGNIARTCLGTDTTLHLIHPLGFSTDDKMVRRAGLDYWKHVDIQEYDSLDELYETYPKGRFYYIENFGTNYYTDYDYSNTNEDIFFVFGRETNGIPKDLLEGKEDQCLRIHMNDKIRSLNLANSAAILIYEALRQQHFPKMH